MLFDPTELYWIIVIIPQSPVRKCYKSYTQSICITGTEYLHNQHFLDIDYCVFILKYENVKLF